MNISVDKMHKFANLKLTWFKY